MPAYQECTTPNRTHGPPLANPSCNPPAQSSPVLTVGTSDANGLTPLSASSVRYKIRGTAAPPEDSDIMAIINIKDVHCTGTNLACPGLPLADFTGRILLRATIQITDKSNGASNNESATVQKLPIEIPVDCVAISGNEGGRCAVTTTVDALYPPGALTDAKRAVWEFGDVTVRDPGANGTGYGAGCPSTCGDGDENVFMRQGLFVP